MKDYEVTNENDLKIEGGDFVIGESTPKHQADTLGMPKGGHRLYPWFGVDAPSFLLDDDLGAGALKKEIQKQEELDGRVVESIDVFNNGDVDLKSSYEADNG